MTSASSALAFAYSYDTAGRPQTVTVTTQPSAWSTTMYPTILLKTNSYDPMDHLTDFGLGLVSSNATPAIHLVSSFDNRGRIVSKTSAAYSYSVPAGGYSSTGNVLQHTDSITGSWTFQYDFLNRLTTAKATAEALNGENGCWTYDPFGNRTLEAFSTVTTTPCASGANDNAQYTPASYSGTNNRVDRFGYDNAGNVTGDSRNTYKYDPEGRLCAIGANGSSTYTQYFYNAAGLRVAKGHAPNASCLQPTTTNGFTLTNQYLLGTSGEQVTEMDGAGNSLHSNISLGGELATYNFSNGGLHFGISDPLGTKRAQVAGTGTAELTCLNLPFGNDFGNTLATNCSPVGASTAPDATEHHFTGKERDQESGNDYFGARYYASSIGRWLSPDWSAKAEPVPYAKLDDPQSLNLYAYVRNKPLSRTDKDGHCDMSKTWCQFISFLACFCQPIQRVPLPAEAVNAMNLLAQKATPVVAAGAALLTKTEQLDVVSNAPSGDVNLREAKSSETAPLTDKQAAAFPEIKESGATVVGKGKPGFPGGTQIPPTEVEVIRPPVEPAIIE